MAKKKYSSYAEIDKELEILKLQQKIYYKKTILSISKTKESIFPSKSVSVFSAVYKTFFSGNSGFFIKTLLPYFFKWFIHKKRGN